MKTTGYIDSNGKYHRGQQVDSPWDVIAQHKEWSHDIQRREYAQDIIQPWNSKNKPSREFIELYPEEAEKFFTKDVIEKAKRGEYDR